MFSKAPKSIMGPRQCIYYASWIRDPRPQELELVNCAAIEKQIYKQV